MVNIVIPIAGAGSRFEKAGYEKPKPFIDVAGKPMIVRVLENLAYKDARYIFISRKEHMEQEAETVELIKKDYGAVFIAIEKLTEGAASTVLYARKYINNDDALVVANSDQIIDARFADFIDDCFKRELDGSIMTFIDPYKDTKWSFARIDESGLVRETREKVAISEYATVGIYLFSKGKDYVNAAVDMIIENDRVNNEFYVCPVYNYAVRENNKIGIYNIQFDQMHGTGTPEDLDKYLDIIK